ncbi:hypothetical protein VTI74DRAFT_11681 [Chaetomium olivicolor]
MAPPCPAFPARKLPAVAQIGVDGKVRKTEDGGRIDLARDCELLGLLQYECVVSHPEIANSPVRCWPVQRLFRRCQDKRGNFTAETTAWEGTATELDLEEHTIQSSKTASQAATKSNTSV